MKLISYGRRNPAPSAHRHESVQALPNPHKISAMRDLDGRHPDVVAYVLDNAKGAAMLARLEKVALRLHREHGDAATLAVGCYGGRHRSVAIVDALAARLARLGVFTSVTHRDLQSETTNRASAPN